MGGGDGAAGVDGREGEEDDCEECEEVDEAVNRAEGHAASCESPGPSSAGMVGDGRLSRGAANSSGLSTKLLSMAAR